MKKLLMFITLIIAVLALSACDTANEELINERVDAAIEAELADQLDDYITAEDVDGLLDSIGKLLEDEYYSSEQIDQLLTILQDNQITIAQFEALLAAIEPTIIEVPQIISVYEPIEFQFQVDYTEGTDLYWVNNNEVVLLSINYTDPLFGPPVASYYFIEYWQNGVSLGYYVFTEDTAEFNMEFEDLETYSYEDYIADIRDNYTWEVALALYQTMQGLHEAIEQSDSVEGA